MRRIVLANETDWEGWRKATRSLILGGAPPEDVGWSVRSRDDEGDPLPDGTGSFGVSRALVSLAFQARDPERFALPPRCLAWVVTTDFSGPWMFLSSAERRFSVPA
jgi:DNA polymerase